MNLPTMLSGVNEFNAQFDTYTPLSKYEIPTGAQYPVVGIDVPTFVDAYRYCAQNGLNHIFVAAGEHLLPPNRRTWFRDHPPSTVHVTPLDWAYQPTFKSDIQNSADFTARYDEDYIWGWQDGPGIVFHGIKFDNMPEFQHWGAGGVGFNHCGFKDIWNDLMLVVSHPDVLEDIGAAFMVNCDVDTIHNWWRDISNGPKEGGSGPLYVSCGGTNCVSDRNVFLRNRVRNATGCVHFNSVKIESLIINPLVKDNIFFNVRDAIGVQTYDVFDADINGNVVVKNQDIVGALTAAGVENIPNMSGGLLTDYNHTVGTKLNNNLYIGGDRVIWNKGSGRYDRDYSGNTFAVTSSATYIVGGDPPRRFSDGLDQVFGDSAVIIIPPVALPNDASWEDVIIFARQYGEVPSNVGPSWDLSEPVTPPVFSPVDPPVEPPATDDPAILVNTSVLDFGDVDVGESIQLAVAVTNTGGGRLYYIVTNEDLPKGMDYVSGHGEQDLVTGESRDIVVEFTPSSDGIYDGSIMIIHNDINAPSLLSVSVVGIGVGEVVEEPEDDLVFGQILQQTAILSEILEQVAEINRKLSADRITRIE